MRLRVVSGIYGGRELDAPRNSKTHPMGERVKNAMFNTIGDEIKKAEVLDAFAGTGALGIEALSRGAKSVVMIEKDRVAQSVICNNIKSFNIASQTKLIRASVASWLETADHSKQFDIILVDPPYHKQQLSTVSELFKLLKPGGLMVLSYTGIGGVPIQDEIVVVDNRSYGNAHLTYFRREV